MTRSVYIIGGAGTGKSTFTAQLLANQEFGPLEKLFSHPNKKNIVTLRGHRLGQDGLYLGCMRDRHPGTDGLDRASSPVGEAWLMLGDVPSWIIGEGATLATRRFLTALHEHTELLLVHLTAEEYVKDLRFLQRNTKQDPQFVLATETRSLNLALVMAKAGTRCLTIDTADPDAWSGAQHEVEDHLWDPF